jgi:hypothetical protein
MCWSSRPSLRGRPCNHDTTMTNGEFVHEYTGFRAGRFPVVAPNNGPTWSQKNQTCLDKINSTPDGKFYNFMSPLSMIPGIGPEWKSSIAEDVGGGGAKYVAYTFFDSASRTMVRTPFGSLSGGIARSMHAVVEDIVAPVSAAAMAGQLTVHAGCAISASF